MVVDAQDESGLDLGEYRSLLAAFPQLQIVIIKECFAVGRVQVKEGSGSIVALYKSTSGVSYEGNFPKT